jgi:DNA-binding transcriptional ArsR family regulator
MHHLIPVFSALADPIRLAIVERLLRDGAQNAGALGDVADVSAPAISRHLKVLRDAGVVEQRVAGQQRIYAIRTRALDDIEKWITDRRAFWSASLDRLDTALKEDEKWRT